MMPQNYMLELRGMNLKQSVVAANRLLADALAANQGLPKKQSKEEILIEYFPLKHTKKQMRKGSKGKQTDLRAKTNMCNNKEILDVLDTIVKELNPKRNESFKKKRSELLSSIDGTKHKPNRKGNSIQQAESTSKNPIKNPEKLVKLTLSTESFKKLMRELAFSDEKSSGYSLGPNPVHRVPSSRIKTVHSEMELPQDMLTACDLERKISAFRQLFEHLIVKHHYLRRDALKIAQGSDTFKDVQLSDLLPFLKTPNKVGNA